MTKNSEVHNDILDVDTEIFYKDLLKTLVRRAMYEFKWGREDAEDLAIIALNKAISGTTEGGLDGVKKLAFKILHNEHVSKIRKLEVRKKRGVREQGFGDENAMEAALNASKGKNVRVIEDGIIKAETAAERKALFAKYAKRLPKRDQKMLSLHLMGYSDPEIVERLQLDITPKTVNNRRNEALKKLAAWCRE